MPDPRVTDTEAPVTYAFLARQQELFRMSLDQIVRRLSEKATTFDSYRPQSLSGESTSSFYIPTDYELEEVRTLIVTGPTGPLSSQSVVGQGSVVTPGANVLIANSAAVPVTGLYTVNWTVGIETAAASVADNFAMSFGGAVVAHSENAEAIGDYSQVPQLLYITAGNTVAIRSGSADATATYSANLTLDPYNEQVPFTLILGDRVWQLSLPNTGILTERFNPGIFLKQSDVKQLTSPIAANWSVELTGYRSDQ